MFCTRIFAVAVRQALIVSRCSAKTSILDTRQNLSVSSYSIRSNLLKTFCTNNTDDRIVNYEDVVSYKDKPEVFLIDLREPKELQENGVLPASINITMGDLNNFLQNANPNEFKSKYGRDYPTKDAQLVFSCASGGRAKTALDAALALGYHNAKFYKGSWKDWASHQ